MAVPQDSETYSRAEDKTHIQVLRRVPMLQYIVLKIGKPYSRDVFAGRDNPFKIRDKPYFSCRIFIVRNDDRKPGMLGREQSSDLRPFAINGYKTLSLSGKRKEYSSHGRKKYNSGFAHRSGRF